MNAPTLPRFARGADPAAVASALAAQGAAVIEAILPAGEVATLDRDMAAWFNKAPCGEGLFFGTRTRRFSALLTKSLATWPLAIHPLIVAAIESVLGAGEAGRCDAIQLNLTQAIGIEPGQDLQAPHRDDSMFPFDHNFEVMVNALWTLDPFTPENGATLIAPGSHLWARTRAPTFDDLTQATAPAGSVILWTGSTIHGGGANRSTSIRRGLTFSYSLGWLAQAEKLLLSHPPELVRTMPVRLQKMLGYQVHKPNLGWIEERDPLEWLNGAVSHLAPAQDHLTPAQSARVAAFHAERAG